ncbi:MAG TPA: T9SS type A sorting domain-containing protein, partial [Cyclobacteriaceae bacterium]
PNPIESSFHIRVNEVKADVLVFDVYGAIVYKSQLVDGNSEIDASGLPPGLYVLKVQGQSLYQKKLIKR